MVRLVALALSLALIATVFADRPSYDHQNVTYNSPFKPVSISNTYTSMMPYFSPDTSTPVEVELINNARSTIDVSIPSFSSWAGCTYAPPGRCLGCYARELQANETFPVWQALVNAVHRGVKVRIVTNDYSDDLCAHKMTPLIYLALAGAQVRAFTTTTFTHSKYICADKSRAAISSINFSKSSFIHNREAGIVIEDATIVGFSQQVFEYDFSHGYPWKFDPAQYDARDMDVVYDKSVIPITMPPKQDFKCNIDSGDSTLIREASNLIKIIASPDNAYEEYMASLKSTKSKLRLSIYQITEDSVCDLMLSLKNSGIDVKIFVSNDIFDQGDAAAAKKCYDKLYQGGLVVKKSQPKCLTFSHQKYWIVDDQHVMMSTGNLSPTDMPQPPYVFPPYGESNWRKTNRDLTLQVVGNGKVTQRFQTVFDLDYSQGVDYSPSQ